MQAYNVYLSGRLVDTVFWNDKADGGEKITDEDVRRSLIDHDGYSLAIVVMRKPK